jgi:hypothetical protein
MANLDDLYPSKYIKSSDLAGNTHAVTIERMEIETMPKGERKPVLYFKNRTKGIVLNRTNADTIGAVFGKSTDNWMGQKIDLFATRVQGPNGMVDGIRVRAVKAVTAPRPVAAEQPFNDSVDDIGVDEPAPF